MNLKICCEMAWFFFHYQDRLLGQIFELSKLPLVKTLCSVVFRINPKSIIAKNKWHKTDDFYP